MRQWLWSEPQDGRCFPFQERNIGEVLSGGRTFSRHSFLNVSLSSISASVVLMHQQHQRISSISTTAASAHQQHKQHQQHQRISSISSISASAVSALLAHQQYDDDDVIYHES